MKPIVAPTKGNFIPCCYFPTTTLLIDDNARFLQGMQRFLGKQRNTKPFDVPAHVLKFIEEHKASHNIPWYLYLSLKGSSHDLPEESVNVDISDIIKILQRKNRFDEASVAVVDYAMPGMNGIEISQKIRSECLTPIKIIMLTGEADEQTAVTGFNEGVIDKFIKKSAEDCLEKVKEYILSLELKFFQAISKTMLESFRARSNSVLEEPEFIKVFNQVCEEQKIVEYYLIEDSGSFLMLDKNGKVTRLIVKTEEDMQMFFELASDYKGLSSQALKKLEDKKCLIYFVNQESRLSTPKNWRLEDAQTIKGKQNYYYAIIKGTNHYPFDTQDILSYDQYLKNKK